MRWVALVMLVAVPCFAGDCRTEKFQTELVKEACADGGQKAARDAMKRFQKSVRTENPELDCKSCHRALAPDYPTKRDALEQFKKLGGH